MRWRTAHKNRKRLSRPVWTGSTFAFADDGVEMRDSDIIRTFVRVGPSGVDYFAEIERDEEMLGPYPMVETSKSHTRRSW